MTPRAEAMSDSPAGRMVVWKCPEDGSLSTEPSRCFWHPVGLSVERERIEVVPRADYERALDALERFYDVTAEQHADAVPEVIKDAWREVRDSLRAAGRLDG